MRTGVVSAEIRFCLDDHASGSVVAAIAQNDCAKQTFCDFLCTSCVEAARQARRRDGCYVQVSGAPFEFSPERPARQTLLT